MRPRLVISLFARPSFIGGASRVLDLFGTSQEYNNPPTPHLADHRAMLTTSCDRNRP